MTNPRPLSEVIPELIEQLKQEGLGTYEAELEAELETGNKPLTEEEAA